MIPFLVQKLSKKVPFLLKMWSQSYTGKHVFGTFLIVKGVTRVIGMCQKRVYQGKFETTF